MVVKIAGNRMLSYAEEDPLEDEAEVEGENDMEEVGVTDDEEEETKTTASPDADTTILFVKPISTGTSLGICIVHIIHYNLLQSKQNKISIRLNFTPQLFQLIFEML